VAFGATKLFVKSPKTLFALETARAEAIPGLVAKIQARYRGLLGRRRVRKIRAVYTIIAFWHKSHTRRYMASLHSVFKVGVVIVTPAVMHPEPSAQA